jgi:hypothetical protein
MNRELAVEYFQEIPADDLRSTQGGAWPIVVGLALIVAEEIASDWDNFKNGLLGRPEEK